MKCALNVGSGSKIAKKIMLNFNSFSLQALKQELVDTRDDHNRERRELEMSQNELIK